MRSRGQWLRQCWTISEWLENTNWKFYEPWRAPGCRSYKCWLSFRYPARPITGGERTFVDEVR